MNNSQREKIANLLKQQKKTTQQKITKYREACKPIPPENSIGRISRMDAINNKSVVEAALREAKKKMQELKLMETKINTPDFGLCLRCKKEIPFQRLMVMPESKCCVNCAK